MKLPAGNVRRLFLGFTCSIMFLVVFAVLIAYNTKAESSSYSKPVAGERALAISIPTAKPMETISFYKGLGFKTVPGLAGELDVVCLAKEGTPYKLEIYHNKFSNAGRSAGGVSGLSFQVADLPQEVKDLRSKGFSFSDQFHGSHGNGWALIRDPNGIDIKLFER